MVNKWYNFHLPRVKNQEYEKKFEQKYEPFFRMIRDIVLYETDNKTFNAVEYGCGIGTTAKIVLKQNPSIRLNLIDRDREVLKLLKKNLTWRMKTKCLIEAYHVEDTIFPLRKGQELCYSHGLLEHFNDITINDIIHNQTLDAKIVLNYVPTNKYKTKSFGDERLMSKEEWYNIFNIKPTAMFEFNDGYDMLMLWRKDVHKRPKH